MGHAVHEHSEHTITFLRVGVSSTATMYSPWGPRYPYWATAAVPSVRSNCRNSGSVHARATNSAPRLGLKSSSKVFFHPST